MVRLLLCGFGSFPAAPRNPSAAVVEALAARAWAPPNAHVDFLTLPVLWRGSAEAVAERAAKARVDGVLVVGVAVEADDFRVETLGRNAASCERLDHSGAAWPHSTIQVDGPPILAATAPVDAMYRALITAGLPARLSDDAGDYLCNFTLYRMLHGAAAPTVGFLHVPQARDLAVGAAFNLADVERAVVACASAFAEALTTRRPVAGSRRA